jgi:hypothetical protein
MARTIVRRGNDVKPFLHEDKQNLNPTRFSGRDCELGKVVSGAGLLARPDWHQRHLRPALRLHPCEPRDEHPADHELRFRGGDRGERQRRRRDWRSLRQRRRVWLLCLVVLRHHDRRID